MRVWLTRTQPGADRQALDLRAAGNDVEVAPVLAAVASGARPPDRAADITIFLSEQAVRHAGDLTFCDGSLVLAIGEQTRLALAAAGISALSPEDERSEGLLKMPALQSISGQRVVLVAGEGGRAVIESALSERGASVSTYHCYRRVEVADVRVAVSKIDVVVIASGDAAGAAADAWRRSGGERTIPALVPSARVADIAREAGFDNVVQCAGADSRAILSALKRISVP